MTTRELRPIGALGGCDVPTDSSKRRIHDPKHKSVLRMTDSDHLLLQRVRALCEARIGGPLTDLELVRMLASDALCHEFMDERPGWKRVSVTHFQILASPNPGGDPDELVTEDEDGQPIVISRSALEEQLLPKLPPRELVRDATIRQASASDPAADPDGDGASRAAGTSAATSAATDEMQVELVYTDTSALDPRNNGPLAPEEERAAPTSSEMRKQVLERDRRRCLVCGLRENLAALGLIRTTPRGRVLAERGGRAGARRAS